MIDIHSHVPSKKIITLVATESEKEWEGVRNLGINNLPCIGLHPNYISNLESNIIDSLLFEFENNIDKFFAVSEVGLDFKNKDEMQISKQKKAIEKILSIAEKHSKVLIVHNRKSIQRFIDIRKSYGVKVIYHNYEGNISELNKIVEMKDFISISTGFLKFKKDNILRRVPLQNLFFETDSPALSPNNEPNVPENVELIMKYFANIRNLGMEELNKIINQNFIYLFGTSSAYWLRNLDLYK